MKIHTYTIQNNRTKCYFSSEEEAVIFRDNFVLKIRGEYTRFNFPVGGK